MSLVRLILEATWETFYDKDPVPPKSTPTQAKLVLGGEASMWGEFVDAANIHQVIWMRAAAVAERCVQLFHVILIFL